MRIVVLRRDNSKYLLYSKALYLIGIILLMGRGKLLMKKRRKKGDF